MPLDIILYLLNGFIICFPVDIFWCINSVNREFDMDLITRIYHFVLNDCWFKKFIQNNFFRKICLPAVFIILHCLVHFSV